MANELIKPLGDRVLIRPVEEAGETKKGGIIIPTTAKDKPQEGVVVAVGNGRALDDGGFAPMLVQVGDRVLYGKFSGVEVKVEDKVHLMMTQDDLLGVFEPTTSSTL